MLWGSVLTLPLVALIVLHLCSFTHSFTWRTSLSWTSKLQSSQSIGEASNLKPRKLSSSAKEKLTKTTASGLSPRRQSPRTTSKPHLKPSKFTNPMPIVENKKLDMLEVNQTRLKIDNIIVETVNSMNLNGTIYIHNIKWTRDRCEVIVSSSPLNITVDSYSNDPTPEFDAEHLRNMHYNIYSRLELDPIINTFLEKNEILIATPGIGDILLYDRDFRSFQSFPIIVKLSEEFKQKTEFEGTLIERTEEFVRISAKGRAINIPRNIVLEVRLPAPQYEDMDIEMQKLR